MKQSNHDDVTNAELAHLINAGFTGVQQQIHRMQNQISALGQAQQQLQQQVEDGFEEVNDRLESMEKRLKATIRVTDAHDRVLQHQRRSA
ncbi:hypothetical protein HY375_02915 [Candidatus Berkelbacteria bacterium]|nr:hypothetical protein [Candidatus Berkelbacteria bacterium]